MSISLSYFCRRLSAAVGALLLVSVLSSGVVCGEISENQEIASLIYQIRHQPDAGARYKLTGRLAIVVRQMAPDKINNQNVAYITSLLNDSDDGVRHVSAIALGNIGPRARSAIPALKAALCIIDGETRKLIAGPDISSDEDIRLAISKIDGSPISHMQQEPDPGCSVNHK